MATANECYTGNVNEVIVVRRRRRRPVRMLDTFHTEGLFSRGLRII